MRRPFIAYTRCTTEFPRTYLTYRQRIVPPYRTCDRARVIRLWRWGLVLGVYRHELADEDDALLYALGGRRTTLLTTDGTLRPEFRREPTSDV